MQKKQKLKILEICEFSAGICGVWQRVKQEASLLAKKNYEVMVFSSDIVKGTDETAPDFEKINGVNIYRFKNNARIHKILTKNVTSFNFQKKFNEIKPDIVITHLIHPHSFKALEMCRKNNIPCYLVTHAPFAIKRKFLLSLLTKIYYNIKVKPNLNKFRKIIAITKWEIPYLLNFGVKKEKISHIPNGIPEEFFKEKIKKFRAGKILFLGRISLVKNIEVLISAFKKLSKKQVQAEKLQLEIIGPIEKGYEKIKSSEDKNITFLPPIYDLTEKINKIQEADIFVLPSKREGMPQSLIEAMSLGKIVVASDTLGAKDLIKNRKNGFLFKIGNSEDLKNTLNKILNTDSSEIYKIQKNAKDSIKIFCWTSIIEKIEKAIKQ